MKRTSLAQVTADFQREQERKRHEAVSTAQLSAIVAGIWVVIDRDGDESFVVWVENGEPFGMATKTSAPDHTTALRLANTISARNHGLEIEDRTVPNEPQS